MFSLTFQSFVLRLSTALQTCIFSFFYLGSISCQKNKLLPQSTESMVSWSTGVHVNISSDFSIVVVFTSGKNLTKLFKGFSLKSTIYRVLHYLIFCAIKIFYCGKSGVWVGGAIYRVLFIIVQRTIH